ncbi:kinase-like protein [Penicillium macrosclerotiorum]|uniref:kinase-like protein n=1 Tax=Penicillium macrosclerotiorum TaxID=303699 RepID=UPI0025484261|nr:kinase-like protein [Penicillium macrosclerotiorum]KAJ5693273.1 kinase-like protein [Penicillium macrosclerotiorum]
MCYGVHLRYKWPKHRFSCSNLSRATEEELFEILENSEIEQLIHTDSTPLQPGLPIQIVKAAEWIKWIDEDEEELRLLDIGESFIQGKEPEKLAQPSFSQLL